MARTDVLRGGGRRGASALVVVAIALVLLTLTSVVAGEPFRATNVSGRSSDGACRTPSCSAQTGLPAPSPFADTGSAAGSPADWAWSPIRSPPVAGAGAGLAADGPRETAVLFGGNSSGTLLSNTTVYDATTGDWTPLSSPGNSPSARAYAAMGSDVATNVAILFGGLTGTNPQTVNGSTYRFNFVSQTWSRTPAGPAPPARDDAAFAVDPQGGGMGVLFGGAYPNYHGVGVLTYADTWEINLTTYQWTDVTSSAGPNPPPLQGARLVWDDSNQLFYLFGGCYPCSDRVWQLNVSDPAHPVWAELPAAADAPTARMDTAWAWDNVSEVALLFGGTDGANLFNDTYLFQPTANAWVPLPQAVAPGPRFSAASDWLGAPTNGSWIVAGGAERTGPGADAWRFSATTNITVLVTDATRGLPIAGAFVVTAANGVPVASGFTASTGLVTLTRVPSSPVNLSASAPGYATNATTVWPPTGETPTYQVNLSAVPPANVNVRVDGPGGEPFAGANVSLLFHGSVLVSPVLTTNSTGWANYTGVPACEGAVEATAPGFLTVTESVDFVSGRTVNVTLSLSSSPALDILALGIVQTSAIRLQGVSVFLDGVFVANTSSNGWLNTSVAETGPVEVEGQVAAFNPGFANVTVPSSGTRDVTLTLLSLPLGGLLLTVVNANGSAPIAHANATITGVGRMAVGPVTVAAFANQSGQMDVPLVAGNYTFTVSAPGFNTFYGPDSISITSGNTTAFLVTLIANPLAEVHFLILDQNSSLPIANASLNIGGREAGLSDRFGWVNLTQLIPGSNVSVVASASGFLPNTTHVTFRASEVDPRFPINLTPLPQVNVSTGGTANITGLSFTNGGAFPLWELLLIPALAVAGAVLYLVVLRVPTVPGIGPSGRRPPGPVEPPPP